MPGEDSFTSALIWALETLVERNTGGRFTTAQLAKAIRFEAPKLRKGQKPQLFNRERLSISDSIMLHPLHQKEKVISPAECDSAIEVGRSYLTLHFEFSKEPEDSEIEELGRMQNNAFKQNKIGVKRVKWGGVNPSPFGHAVRRFSSFRKRPSTTVKASQQAINADCVTPPTTQTESPESASPTGASSSGVAALEEELEDHHTRVKGRSLNPRKSRLSQAESQAHRSPKRRRGA